MNNTTKNILIIGDGIAAWALQERFSHIKNLKISNFSCDDFHPGCSYRTTSINCLRGTTKGISKLGDLICNSYDEFLLKHNFSKYDGVYKGSEFQIWGEEDKEKWERRYSQPMQVKSHPFLNNITPSSVYYVENEAYFIDPYKLKNSLLKGVERTEKKAFVKKIDGKKVFTNAGVFEFDYIFVCTNHGTANLLKNKNHEFDYYLDHCKTVAGSYLEMKIEKTDLCFKSDFNLVLNGHHFIYRKSQGVLQIGSTTENNSAILTPRMDLLDQIHKNIATKVNIDIPQLEKFEAFTGIRQKGYKRMPFWGRVDANTFAICGLYKNGFTFAFLAAKELEMQLSKELGKSQS